MSAQAGIKQLLDAETEAQKIVNQARQDKLALLKKARDEAQADVDDYRSRKQKEFEESIATQNTETGDYHAKLAKETEQDIHKIQHASKAKSEDVVQLLLKSVGDVVYDNVTTARH